MRPYPLFCMANVVYKYAFWLYYPFYVLYKNIKDRKEFSIISELIKPGDTVVDIGANIGVYTRRLAKLTGNSGEVYAFEPDPRNFLFLSRFARNTPAIKAFNAAVSDREGTIDLYFSGDMNTDHRTYPTTERRTKRQVISHSLDSYLNGKTVDFIKMDIQGFEYMALKGMRNTLSSSPQLIILMELWPHGLKEATSSCEEVIESLRRGKFFLYLVLNGKVVEYSEKLVGRRASDFYSLLAMKQPYSRNKSIRY
jgi:FkbM family methyltransferase